MKEKGHRNYEELNEDFMNQEQIERLRADVVIPDIVQQKAGAAFKQIHADAKNRGQESETAGGFAWKRRQKTGRWEKYRGKRLAAGAAAAVLMLGTISAGAAVYEKWTQGLNANFHLTDEKKQALEDNHMTTLLGESATASGVTITAVQSIVDSYYAYVTFKVEGYELPEREDNWHDFWPSFEYAASTAYTADGKMTARDSKQFGFFDGRIRAEKGYESKYADGTPCQKDEDGWVLPKYTAEDGSLEYIAIIGNYWARDELRGAAVTFRFENLWHFYAEEVGEYQYEPHRETDVEGVWTLDVTLPDAYESREFTLQEPPGDAGATLISAEISPISLRAVYDFPRQSYHIDENGRYTGRPPKLIGVRLKDGTEYTHLISSHVGCLEPNYEGYGKEFKNYNTYLSTFVANRILDVDEVAELIFIDDSWYIDEEGAKEHLYYVPLS